MVVDLSEVATKFVFTLAVVRGTVWRGDRLQPHGRSTTTMFPENR